MTQIVLRRLRAVRSGLRRRDELIDEAQCSVLWDRSALRGGYEIRLVSDDYEAVVFHVLVWERRVGAELGPPPGQGVERCGPIDVEHKNGGICTAKECSGE